ncbi:MAG: hypothetical protein JNK67_14770 [Alphaproteobacteria bacterium]|nr:hypothetical protein [Alphaproteobacteria bacterium]
MLELIVERWRDPASGETYRWSLWEGGRRIAMGGPHGSADAAERDATSQSLRSLGRQPERVTRL